ncbi:MAG: phage major capsid protein [Anaerolineaceae bacterium]|nr:phage major capsid protein [Anaerolineaceae bacterium]
MTKELNEKKNDLITRAEAVLNTAKEEKRELTDAEAQELAEIRDNVRRIVETLKLDDDFRNMERKEDEPMEEIKEMSVEEKETRAFEDYIRGNINTRSGELTPAQGSGEAIIPTTIANRIMKKVYDICPIYARAERYNVKGNLDLPYYGDTSGQTPDNITVAYATEFSALASHSGAFSSVTLSGFLAGALTKISRSLINNAQFNVVDFVIDQMAEAFARFIEGELINGTSQKIAGLSGITTSVTAVATNAVTADEVIKLHDKIKDQYQANAVWIMSPATRTALRLLKDSDNRYMLQDDISLPFGTSLLGKPVWVSDNMPDMATGKTAIIYGDPRGLAVKVSEDVAIEVLREKYADEHAVGVIGWLELDAKVQDQQKLAKLVMA